MWQAPHGTPDRAAAPAQPVAAAAWV